jgi:hypothetical protein
MTCLGCFIRWGHLPFLATVHLHLLLLLHLLRPLLLLPLLLLIGSYCCQQLPQLAIHSSYL